MIKIIDTMLISFRERLCQRGSGMQSLHEKLRCWTHTAKASPSQTATWNNQQALFNIGLLQEVFRSYRGDKISNGPEKFM